jgi:MFS family permease
MARLRAFFPRTLDTSRRLPIVLHICVTLLYWVSLYTYVPTLPVYIESKVGNLAAVGGVLSMYGLWQAFIRLPLGAAADRAGRRTPFIVGGILLSGVGAWLLGVANGLWGLVLGRLVTGLAAGTWVLLVAAFSSYFAREDVIRATSLLVLTGAVARLFATSSTGWLTELGGYRLCFTVATLASGLGALLVFVTQEQRQIPRPTSLRAVGRLVLRRDVLLPSLLNALVQYAVWSTTFGFLPILAERLGASQVTQSLMVSSHILASIIGSLAATGFATQERSRRMAIAAFVVMGLGVLLGAFSYVPLLIFGAQITIGVARGFNTPVLMGMSIQNVVPEKRSTATGAHQAVYGLGMFGGSVVSGVVADAIGIRWMFAIVGAALLLGAFGMSRLRGWVGPESAPGP